MGVAIAADAVIVGDDSSSVVLVPLLSSSSFTSPLRSCAFRENTFDDFYPRFDSIIGIFMNKVAKFKRVQKKMVIKISSPVFSSFIFLRRSCTLTCALIFQSGGLLLLLLTAAAAEHSPLPDGSNWAVF